MRRRVVLCLVLLIGCGGAVASESESASDGGVAATADGGANAPADAGPGRPREVTVAPATVESTASLDPAGREPCGLYDGGACTSGTCTDFRDQRRRSIGALCVEGNACASLRCAVGACVGNDNIDNVKECLPLPGCRSNRDCGPAQPYCVRAEHDGLRFECCAADYASACTYAPCKGANCIVTESDPVAMRCTP